MGGGTFLTRVPCVSTPLAESKDRGGGGGGGKVELEVGGDKENNDDDMAQLRQQAMEARLKRLSASQSDVRRELEEYMTQVRGKTDESGQQLVAFPEDFEARAEEDSELAKLRANLNRGHLPANASNPADAARIKGGLAAIEALDAELAEKTKM